MAKCFDVTGYIEPCNTVRQKYTGRALLITGRSSGSTVHGGVTFSDNGVKVNQIITYGDFEDFVNAWKTGGGKVLPVMIDAQNPFGVTVQGNTDSGRVSYTKTIPVTIPATRDGKAEEFIMGLQKDLDGSSAIVLETYGLDGTSDMSGITNNDIFGSYSPVYIDPTSVTRNEYENGGAWSFNLVCEEPVPNVICTMGGLWSELDKFNAPSQQPAG